MTCSNRLFFLFLFILIGFSCKEDKNAQMKLPGGEIVHHINGSFKTNPTTVKNEMSYDASFYKDGTIIQTTFEDDKWEKYIIPQEMTSDQYPPLLQAMIYMNEGDSVFIALANQEEGEPVSGYGLKLYQILSQNDLNGKEEDMRLKAAEKTEELLTIIETNGKDDTYFKKEENGLYVHTIQKGDGPKANPFKRLKLNYIACTEHLVPFEAQYSYVNPFILQLNQGGYIKGFLLGLSQMNIGDIKILKIPSDLAYGAEGKAPLIEGGETLYFYVELLEMNG